MEEENPNIELECICRGVEQDLKDKYEKEARRKALMSRLTDEELKNWK